jgi:hypothetical protein
MVDRRNVICVCVKESFVEGGLKVVKGADRMSG